MEDVARPAYRRLVELSYGVLEEPSVRALQARCPDAWDQIVAASNALHKASVLVSTQRERIDGQAAGGQVGPARPS